MSSTWRAHVIEQRLREAGIPAQVEERDIYALEPALRSRVLDAIIAEQAAFPVVLVNGEVVTHGELDLDAIADAAREERGRGCCC